MKKYQKFLSGALAFIMLTSCAESGKKETPKNLGSIPLVSIETLYQHDNALNFVTLPVSRHVAKSIASWTQGYAIPPEPYYEECKVSLTSPDKTVLLDELDADVKVRGNWTTSYDKKPLRIKFVDKQNMLGLNDGNEMKNWILLAEYKDASMLRNKAALSIAKELFMDDGLYAADCELVEVEINGEYWGVYLLTEQQQVNSHRINITKAEPDYTGTDIGYLLEFDGYYLTEGRLNEFHIDYADNAPLVPFDGNGGSGRTMKCLPESTREPKDDIGFSIKSDIYSLEQCNFITSFVGSVYKIMYSAAYEDKAYVFNSDFSDISLDSTITPQEAVERVVDVKSLADMYILSEITCDADIYWSSFYMDADFGENGDKKLRFEAPWDFDSSMGNKDRCLDGTGFYAANIVPDVNGGPGKGGMYETINPWLAVLMYEDWFQDIIRDKWTALYDSGTFDRVAEMIETDKERCSAAFERNYDKWNNIADNSAFAGELSSKAAACKTQAEAADFLKEWLGKRVSFLNDYWHK